MAKTTKGQRTIREVFGELALDLGKLTFGGIVLAGIFTTSVNKVVLISGGLVFCATVIGIGVYLIAKK
jgi:hypothetical protein